VTLDRKCILSMTVLVGFLFVAGLLLQSVNGFLISSLPFERTKSCTATFFTSEKSTIHAKVSLKSRLENQEQVMSVPRGAPLEDSYDNDKFYVRACYNTYYHEIMDNLFGKRDYFYISVTGTPGIGKSMFYLYFLNRYRFENPGKSVITASFWTGRELLVCKLFRPDGIVEK
jgi:hypothetical protein